MPILGPLEALKKREQLLRDGFCVVPGVVRGSLLERLRAYTDEVLDHRPVDPKYRYQGSDFHVNSERRYRARVDAASSPRCRRNGPPQRVAAPSRRGEDAASTTMLWSPLVDELVDLPAAVEACDLLGLEGREPDDTMLILSKPAHGPALYWHQDFMEWNHPKACSPWPTRVFISYYTVDTTKDNGCLRAIPGTHRKRIPLHDALPPAHGPEIQAASDEHPAFADHPDAVDLPVKAGDLVINDARVLHAAYPNTTDQRRTLILQWHSVFPYPSVPSWWTGLIPEAFYDFDPKAAHEMTRVPGKFLGAT